ncbi:outer membrane beta-barrel protein [Sphingobacterium sp. SGR-19]|uniref:outer membrane beta-barrel protein n=1 Tax=Sphingobacterium sp. SGR-19 TaxID=2710886 RepID=UPI0013ED0FED|nr:OmpW family outer membrane protein [Sphingobacterium sp. SGR-19]NGM64411.1 porin family protein [Sphingobacterium sp. SGR-19]
MKKLLLTLTAVAGLTVASKAQEFGFQKTDFIVEGFINSSNANDKQEEEKVSKFNFNPKFGYFVSDKIAVGLELAVGNTKTTDYSGENDVYEKGNNFGIGAFGRYYFLEVGSRFKTYAELGAGYNQVGGEFNNGTETTELDKTKGFGVNAGVGANYFLTNNIAVGFSFGNVVAFNSSKVDVDGAKAQNEFTTNINVFDNFFNTAHFGLTFKF